LHVYGPECCVVDCTCKRNSALRCECSLMNSRKRSISVSFAEQWESKKPCQGKKNTSKTVLKCACAEPTYLMDVELDHSPVLMQIIVPANPSFVELIPESPSNFSVSPPQPKLQDGFGESDRASRAVVVRKEFTLYDTWASDSIFIPGC